MTSWENSIFCSSITFLTTALACLFLPDLNCIANQLFFSLFLFTDSFRFSRLWFGDRALRLRPSETKQDLPPLLPLLMGIPCRCRQTPSQVPTTLHYVGTPYRYFIHLSTTDHKKSPFAAKPHFRPSFPGFYLPRFLSRLVCLSVLFLLSCAYYNIRLPSTYLFKLFR